MIGHIKLDRKILNWEWYSDYKMVHLFIHLLLKANYKDNTWQRILVKRGQLITGLSKLSENTGLTISQTRTCLNNLQNTGEISIKTTNKYSIITICKYDIYQSEKNTNRKQDDKQDDTQDNKQIASKIATLKEYKNSKENKKNFIHMPLPENFNGLPEIKIGAVIQLFKISKQTDISKDDVLGFWNIFKIQNLTGEKFYKDETDVYSHFINWVKTQKIEPNGANKQANNTTKFNAGALELLAKGKEQFAVITGKQNSGT